MLLATVRTSVGYWDTGDLQTVAWIAGIPYPTGYPLYVILAWTWTHALPLASVAMRVNALSAVGIAAGSAAVCAAALLLDVAAVLALLGGFLFAFAHTVWYRATYADAHPVGFAVAFVAIVLAVRWARRGDLRALTAAILTGGVALGLDNTTVLLIPGALVVAAARRPPLRAAALALAGACAIVAASYAYLPLRSAQVTAARLDPTLALGIAPGRPFWDDHHPATPDGFLALVAGTDWGAESAAGRVVSPAAAVKAAHRFLPEVRDDLHPGVLAIALLGLMFAATAEPVIVLGLVLAAIVPALFGASYPPEADPERYAFALYAVAALGVAAFASRAVRTVRADYALAARAVAAGVLVIAIGREMLRADDLRWYRDDRSAAQLGADVVRSTADGAIVVAPWDYATPLAYRAYVEHAFGNRVVVCGFVEDYRDDYDRWSGAHQIAVVGKSLPIVPGFRSRVLHEGDPFVFELVRVR